MAEYEHPRPALTTDLVVIADAPGGRTVLLVRRGQPPFQGRWALPGGFVEEGELLEAAARRELEEETGLVLGEQQMEQMGTFGDPGRDPRGWTVSVVFGVVLPGEAPAVRGGDDAAEAAWHPLDPLPLLAFDHDAVIASARGRLGV